MNDMDRQEFEYCVRRMLDLLGEDSTRDGLHDTPRRVAAAWVEMTSGYRTDIPSMFTTFENVDPTYNGMIVVQDIPVISVCEHHLLPIIGKCHIGYIPREGEGSRIVGLSKLARLVNAYSRRLQVQERLTEQIVDALEEHLDPFGCIAVVAAAHSCMSMRGVQAPGTLTTTSAVRGVFRDPSEQARSEFFSLLGL